MDFQLKTQPHITLYTFNYIKNNLTMKKESFIEPRPTWGLKNTLHLCKGSGTNDGSYIWVGIKSLT
ncbi:MAG: hypothetical protein JNL70_08315 [Saprospiraceae bacterium]|nr:hypothetical protein [Saprospiraceae bacterium]